MRTELLLLVSASLIAAHFELNWPPARGFDEDMLPQYPCGGQNTPSDNRTEIPIGSLFPIQLNMGHTEALVTVTLALGSTPDGAAFNTVLVPTLQENGPQNFCLGAVTVPMTVPGSNATIMPGMNGTIQVLTNGDGQGESGLYNCADVTFVSEPLSSATFVENCHNSTGVRASSVSGAQANAAANGTTYGSSNAATSASAGAGASSATSSQGAAAVVVPGGLFKELGAPAVALLMAVVFGSSLI